jgi:hypothetical protein
LEERFPPSSYYRGVGAEKRSVGGGVRECLQGADMDGIEGRGSGDASEAGVRADGAVMLGAASGNTCRG